jgi:hypothetical protein
MDLSETVIIGTVATICTDLWHLFLKRALYFPVANWQMIGRWVVGMSGGKFVHHSITEAPPVAGETAIGWTFHYLVGIGYAALYIAVMRFILQGEPSLVSALLFGIATLAAPWFVMQPALGLGIMARHQHNRCTIAVVTVTTHLIFGMALYLGVIAITGFENLRQ